MVTFSVYLNKRVFVMFKKEPVLIYIFLLSGSKVFPFRVAINKRINSFIKKQNLFLLEHSFVLKIE